MEEKLSGIVLNSIAYGDFDKILNVFTLEKGVISAKIKGVKKAGAKLKFASEPFCFAEFILMQGKAGYTVINASLIDSFYPVRENLFKYYAGATVLEFIKHFYRENITSSQIFLTVVQALKKIAYDNDYLSALVEFLVKGISEVGYGLQTQGCFACGSQPEDRVFFDYRSGAFFCKECFNGEGREVHMQTFLALKKVENGCDLEREEAIKALRLIDFYLGAKTEEKINSLKELIKMLA